MALYGSLNNLASLYHDQGRYAKAEPLDKRALAIREETLSVKRNVELRIRPRR